MNSEFLGVLEPVGHLAVVNLVGADLKSRPNHPAPEVKHQVLGRSHDFPDKRLGEFAQNVRLKEDLDGPDLVHAEEAAAGLKAEPLAKLRGGRLQAELRLNLAPVVDLHLVLVQSIHIRVTHVEDIVGKDGLGANALARDVQGKALGPALDLEVGNPLVLQRALGEEFDGDLELAPRQERAVEGLDLVLVVKEPVALVLHGPPPDVEGSVGLVESLLELHDLAVALHLGLQPAQSLGLLGVQLNHGPVPLVLVPVGVHELLEGELDRDFAVVDDLEPLLGAPADESRHEVDLLVHERDVELAPSSLEQGLAHPAIEEGDDDGNRVQDGVVRGEGHRALHALPAVQGRFLWRHGEGRPGLDGEGRNLFANVVNEEGLLGGAANGAEVEVEVRGEIQHGLRSNRPDLDEELLPLRHHDNVAGVIVLRLRRERDLVLDLHPSDDLARRVLLLAVLYPLYGEKARLEREDLRPPRHRVDVPKGEHRCVSLERLVSLEGYRGGEGLEQGASYRHRASSLERVVAYVHVLEDSGLALRLRGLGSPLLGLLARLVRRLGELNHRGPLRRQFALLGRPGFSVSRNWTKCACRGTSLGPTRPDRFDPGPWPSRSAITHSCCCCC